MTTEPTKITDHQALGDEDRLSQFDNSQALRELLEVKLAQVQLLENVIWDVLQGRDFEDAVGEALSRAGRIVGWPRHGVTDDDEYRRLVRVGAQINRAQGTAPEIILIVSQLLSATLPAVRYIHRHMAHYGLQWELTPQSDDDWIRVILQQMPRITVCGVSWDMIEGPEDSAFTLDDDDLGLDAGELARRVDTL